MKYLAPNLFLAALCVLGVQRLHSQSPVPVKTALEQVQTMRAQNKALLEKQAATLTALDAMQKEAAQIKFLTKRT